MRKTRLLLATLVAVIVFSLAHAAYAVTTFQLNYNSTPVTIPMTVCYPAGYSPSCFSIGAGSGYCCLLNGFTYIISVPSTSNGYMFNGWTLGIGGGAATGLVGNTANANTTLNASTNFFSPIPLAANYVPCPSTGCPTTTTGCIDPLNLGWTGRTVGCFFGVSNIYFVLIVGIPLVIATPFLVAMKPKRTK